MDENKLKWVKLTVKPGRKWLRFWKKTLAEITENLKKKKYVDALQTQLIFQNPQTPQQNSLARLPNKTP